MHNNYPHRQKRTQLFCLLLRERPCCCDTTRNYTGTVQKSGVAPQQQEILPFPKNFGWRLYHVLQISLEFKQKAKGITGVCTLLFCYGKGFSCSLCTQLAQSPKELNWCDQTNRFNNRKSTELWLKSPNTTVSKASLKLAELTFIEELDKDKIQ